MTLTSRMTLILMLSFSITCGVAMAQQAATVASDTTTVQQAQSTTSQQSGAADAGSSTATTDDLTADETSASSRAHRAQEVKNQFNELLRGYPDELAAILVVDPTLLSNESFVAGYPDLQAFVAAHPEVKRNVRYFLSDVQAKQIRQAAYQPESTFEEIFEGMTVLAVLGVIAFALSWLVRTVIEQKRWNRLSRSQSEVHNKIMDRFSSSAELLEYIKTPAGSRFLESAPIPLHADRAPQSTPMTRIMWSIQLGVVIIAGGLGLLLISSRFQDDGPFAMGVIAVCLGAGFIASAYVSITLSRRLGLWEDPSVTSKVIEDPEVMR